jgi:hypothetical protein
MNLGCGFRKLKLGGHGGVCHGNLELQIELVLEQIVHIPALALPFRPVLVRGDSELFGLQEKEESCPATPISLA